MWEVGRALRELGADTNEIEALWAGGFFTAISRLLQRIADGPRLAVQLIAVLPARMMAYETNLCADLDDVEHGMQWITSDMEQVDFRKLAGLNAGGDGAAPSSPTR